MKKKKINLRVSIWVIAFILLSAQVLPVGGSSYQFLKLGKSARALAMAEAYTAVENEVDAVYYNPAGVYGNKSPCFSLMYTMLHHQLGAEMFGMLNAAGKVKLSPKAGDLALAFTTVLYGGVDPTVMDTTSGRLRAAGDVQKLYGMEIILNYSRGFASDHLKLGLNVKTALDKLGNNLSGGTSRSLNLVFDAGALLNFGLINPLLTPLCFGFSANHISYKSRTSSESLVDFYPPLTLKAGLMYTLWLNKNHVLLFSGDNEYVNDEKYKFNIGISYRMFKMLNLKLGYKIGRVEGTYGFKFGFGFQRGSIAFDYAMDFAETGIGNRFQLSYSKKYEQKQKEHNIDALYYAGLDAFAEKDYAKARELFNGCLKMDAAYKPAAERLKEVDELELKQKRLKIFEQAMEEIK